MNSTEKIIELLGKKSLGEKEISELNSLIRNDPEAKKTFDIYSKLNDSLKSKHISYDDLRDYILYKNNIEPEDKNVIKKIPEIELHLKSCNRCLNEFKVLNEEYSGLDLFISDNISSGKVEKKAEISLPQAKPKTLVRPIYVFASVLILGFAYLALSVVSNFTSPDNYNLASLDDKSEFYITRGRSTNEFQESLKALEETNFSRAITYLQNDIKNNPSDETIFYSYYILGLSYLEKADNDFIGLFKSFDKNDAAMGLKNLQLCIDKNTSGKFPDITYNAYFYSAKACIMLGDIEAAKKHLKIVIDEKGSKMFEAEKILNELE